MTQNEQVLKHLNDCGSITSLEAAREYGIMRLSARIYDLKSQGYDISSASETSRNRYGKPVSYFRYSLR